MSDLSQARQILRILKRGETITPLGALRKLGCLRLGARVWDLRQEGHPIVNVGEVTPSGKRIAKYKLGRKAA